MPLTKTGAGRKEDEQSDRTYILIEGIELLLRWGTVLFRLISEVLSVETTIGIRTFAGKRLRRRRRMLRRDESSYCSGGVQQRQLELEKRVGKGDGQERSMKKERERRESSAWVVGRWGIVC